MILNIRYYLFSCLLVFSSILTAQEKKEDPKPIPEPKSFISHHQIINGGKTIRYKATASET